MPPPPPSYHPTLSYNFYIAFLDFFSSSSVFWLAIFIPSRIRLTVAPFLFSYSLHTRIHERESAYSKSIRVIYEYCLFLWKGILELSIPDLYTPFDRIFSNKNNQFSFWLKNPRVIILFFFFFSSFLYQNENRCWRFRLDHSLVIPLYQSWRGEKKKK